MRVPCVVLLAACCAGGCGPAADGAAEGGEPGRPPNLVLLVSDDHDPRHYGFAEHPLARTPALDGLAAGGLLFPVALTAPRCRPTLMALLTGELPHRSGVYYNLGPDWPPEGRERDPLLPALLCDAGYLTYAAGKLPVWAEEAGFTDHPDVEQAAGGLALDTFVRRDQEDLFRFLRSVGDRPFFVWWAPLLPHVPHDPPARLAERFPPEEIPVPQWIAPEERETYRRLEAASLAMVAWLDEGVGALLDELRRLGLERDTLVLYLADNGWVNGLPSKGTPYDAAVTTPLILSWPGRIEPGVEADHLASYLDVFPTLLDYAGVRPPRRADGASLRPFADRRAVEERAIAFDAAYPSVAGSRARAERDVIALFARTQRWKYVRWVRDVEAGNDHRLRIKHLAVPFPERRAGAEELYDLERDPLERADLSADPGRQALLADLRDRTLAWWRATGGGALPE